jgi:hypothetical protein
LSFEGIRITASIRIVTDTQFHLVACVEVSKVARIADTQKNCRDRTMENSTPEKKYLPVKNWCRQKFQRLENLRFLRPFLESVKFIFDRFPSCVFTLKVLAFVNLHEPALSAKKSQKTCAIKG